MSGSQCTQDYIANLLSCDIFLPQGIVSIEETVKHHGHHVLLLVTYARYNDTFRKKEETEKTRTVLLALNQNLPKIISNFTCHRGS